MQTNMHRRMLAALAGIATLCVVAPPAGAVSTSCELSLSPAQTEPSAPLSGTFRQAIALQNNGAQPCDVTLAVQQMLHDLDGTPRYATSSEISAAFAIGKSRVTLAPQGRDSVTLSGAIPSGAHSAYLAVVATYETPGQQAGTTIAIRTQIASQYLLRGPKPWNEKVQITDVGMMPGGTASKREVYATVKNLGNVHVRPSASVAIYDEAGRKIGVARLEADRKPPPAVLPGLSRRFVGTWTPNGAIPKTIRLEGTVNGVGGTSKFSRAVSFNRQGAPIVKSATLLLNAKGVDKAMVTATVRNTGNEVLHAALVTIVARQDDKFERARQAFPLPPLAPSAARTLSWTQELPKGAYIVQATVEDDKQLLDEKSASFEIGALAASTKKHRGLLLYLAVALVLLAASGSVMTLARTRARQAA
jgi:hypothetical protein